MSKAQNKAGKSGKSEKKGSGPNGSGENEYGDADDTMYTGGTPLFDETTGTQKSRKDHVPTRPPKKK